MKPENPFDGKVGFCVGTGRCGTTFFARVVGHEPHVAANHERQRLAATFHMFCKWHGIGVDGEGFLLAKEEAIRDDLTSSEFSLESSALLSHSLAELHQRFDARFLLLIRNPVETVASFAARGWFVETPTRSDVNLPPSYQGREGEKARHFLGRIIPNGTEFDRWMGLTPIGRIAWFWKARNLAILHQFSQLSPSRCRIQRLEEFDFDRYREASQFFGWQSLIDASTYHRLADSRLNSGPNPPCRVADWTPTEIAEFEAEVAPLASALGYQYRVAALLDTPAKGVMTGDAPRLSDFCERFGQSFC